MLKIVEASCPHCQQTVKTFKASYGISFIYHLKDKKECPGTGEVVTNK